MAPLRPGDRSPGFRESAAGHWEDWDSIRCPTLILRGEHGMSAKDVVAMASRLTHAAGETVPDADTTFTSISPSRGERPSSDSSRACHRSKPCPGRGQEPATPEAKMGSWRVRCSPRPPSGTASSSTAPGRGGVLQPRCRSGSLGAGVSLRFGGPRAPAAAKRRGLHPSPARRRADPRRARSDDATIAAGSSTTSSRTPTRRSSRCGVSSGTRWRASSKASRS